MKKLNWEDIAEFYKQKTGGRARIRPMDEIYEWATKQPEISVHKDSTLSFKDTDKSERIVKNFVNKHGNQTNREFNDWLNK